VRRRIVADMTNTPDLTRYQLAHDAMRSSAHQFAAAIADLDLTDHRRIRAMRWWYGGFLGELHAHHTVEDELFFPALAARVPTFAADHDADLAAEHHRLDQVMGALGDALRGLAEGAAPQQHHRAAREQADELARLLDHHLGIEDDDVLPLFARHFTVEEYEALDDEALKRIGPRQLLFTVPWAVATADDQTRAHTLAEAPAPIRIIWRLTRRRYLRRTALVMGPTNVAVAR
jgi:hypothetical protein